LLGGCADKGNRAHHGDRVEAGAGEEGGVEKEEGREDGGLGEVEGGPKSVFLDVAGNESQRKTRSGRLRVAVWKGKAYLSGCVANVPYIDPILAAKLTPITTHGFVAMSL